MELPRHAVQLNGLLQLTCQGYCHAPSVRGSNCDTVADTNAYEEPRDHDLTSDWHSGRNSHHSEKCQCLILLEHGELLVCDTTNSALMLESICKRYRVFMKMKRVHGLNNCGT